MKTLNKYDVFFLCGLLFGIIESIYFGLNDHPITNTEKLADMFAIAMMTYGGFCAIGQCIAPKVTINNITQKTHGTHI